MKQTIEEHITEIEKEIRETPYHKGTEHHIGKLKSRLAKLKDEILITHKGGGGGGYGEKKTGDASVIFVGPPSVGKSTLLNKITNANSRVAAYDFTTISVIPGMMDYKGAKIQIFDVPGIVQGAAKGKGRGKEVLSVARTADLIAIMVDIKTINLIPKIINELYENGIRINEEKPKVTIIKSLSGGIKINATTSLSLNYGTIKSIAQDFHLPNAEIIIKENITIDRLIDSFINNRIYLPFLIIVNKIDIADLNKIKKETDKYDCVLISAEKEENLNILKEKIWGKLNFIRIYLKKGDETDYLSPFILSKGKTLKDMIENISICNKDSFSYAKIYGPGAKYPGQEVSFSFIPQDETIVQFV